MSIKAIRCHCLMPVMGIVGRSRSGMEAWQQSLNREQVSDAESGLIAPERFSNKLENVDQIANSQEFGQQVNANFQPESACL